MLAGYWFFSAGTPSSASETCLCLASFSKNSEHHIDLKSNLFFDFDQTLTKVVRINMTTGLMLQLSRIVKVKF